jgi:hypothetical protein
MSLRLLKCLLLILLVIGVAGGPPAHAAMPPAPHEGPAAAAQETPHHGSQEAFCTDCPQVCPCTMPCGQTLAVLATGAAHDGVVPALAGPDSDGVFAAKPQIVQWARGPPHHPSQC